MELTKYLGVTNFIWITGIRGEDNYDESPYKVATSK